MSRIDVHHHVYAPFYSEILNARGGDPSGWYIPNWTLALDRDLCGQVGIRTAISSATAPGPEIASDPAQAASLARKLNEFNAGLRDKDPQHYGFFASVPSLLDSSLCIAEIRYALDVLHADGIVLMTRYGSAYHYLGHEQFAPIWEELNKRKAVVFVHPTHPVDTNLVNKSLPQPMFDYPHETGRTAVDLMTSGTFRKHASQCKIILSHGGGTLPMLLGRVAGLGPVSGFGDKTEHEIYEEARWFYYDTALTTDSPQLAALRKVATHDHILYGSDFPNAPTQAIQHFAQGLDGNADLSDDDKARISHRSALSLFPRLAV
ncbi:Amidohydrolase-like protein 1 [Elsinoe fawcettii]|nr:Amidohydrolase-like protein 1 [Elsinoe fawcettii]